MMSSFFSVTLTLFFVINSFAVIPPYLCLVKKLNPKRKRMIAYRELFFALVIMILFHYVGDLLLNLLSLTTSTVQISGGIVLFLIAISMIFSHHEEREKIWGQKEPFIVPIATPLIAGPSVLALIMINTEEFTSDLFLVGTIVVAWAAACIILLLSAPIYRLIGDKGLMACERLMGLFVALIAVQKFMAGIEGIATHL